MTTWHKWLVRCELVVYRGERIRANGETAVTTNGDLVHSRLKSPRNHRVVLGWGGGFYFVLFLGVWVLEVGYGRGEGKGDPC